MADGSVLIDAKLNTSPVEKGLNALKGMFSGSGIAKAGSAVFTGITTAVTAAGAALTAMGGYAVKVGTDFDTAMSQVAATMGTTVDQIPILSETAKKMGATTAFSATQAAEALNYLALAGYDAEKAADVLPAVLDLAAAGSMDLAYASDLATDAMSALGIEASKENLTLFGDQMAMTASKANTSVAQLGEAILNIGGTAKSLSGGTVELNTALGILANRGIKGSEAGNHLRNVIMSLSAPTDQAKKALKKMGIQVADSSGKMRPLNKIMEDFNKKTAGMSDVAKNEYLAKIFNKEDLAAVQALLAGVGVEWDELEQYISECDGAMSDMAKTQLDNLAGDVTILKSALEGLGIAAYEKVREPLRDIVKLATSMIDQLSTALTEKGFSGFATALGDVLANAVTTLTGYLPQVVTMGADVIKSLVQGISDNSDQIATAAADALGVIATAVIELLPDLTVAAAKLILSFAQRIPNLLTLVVSAVKNVDWAGCGKQVLDLIIGAFSSWTDTAGDISTFAKTILTSLTTSITGSENSDIATSIGSLISGISREDISTAASSLAKTVFDGLVAGFGAITSGASSIAGAIGSFLSGLNKADFGTSIGTAATTVLDAIFDAIAVSTTTPDMSAFVTSIGIGIEQALIYLGDISGAIVGYILSADGLVSIAQAGAGIWNAIWGGFCNALLGAANGVTQVFLSLFEIVASSVCDLFGLDFGDSMTKAMNEMTFDGIDGTRVSGKFLNSLIGGKRHTISEQAQAYCALVAAGFEGAANQADFTPAGVAIATALQNSLTDAQTGNEQWMQEFSTEQTKMMAALIATGMDAGFAEQYPALYAAGLMAGDGVSAGVETLIPLMQELGMEIPQSFSDALGNESAWAASNDTVNNGLEKLKQTIEQQGEQTKQALTDANTTASDIAVSVGESSAEVNASASEIVTAAQNAATAQENAEVAQTAVATATEGIAADTSMAVDTVTGAADTVTTTVETIATDVVTTLESVASSAHSAGESVIQSFVNGIATKAESTINDCASALFETISVAICTAFGSSDGESATEFSFVGESVVTGVADGITKHAVESTFSSAASKVYTSAKGALESAIGNDGSKFAEIGKDICRGIAKGIKDNTSIITEAARRAANAAYEAAKDELGISSPSRRFAELGMYCAKGLTKGLMDHSSDFVNSYQGLIERARKYAVDNDILVSATERMLVAVDDSTSVSDGGAYESKRSIDYNELAKAIWDNAPEDLAVNQTINFNEPVKTPDETARAIRQNNTYGLVGGKR